MDDNRRSTSSHPADSSASVTACDPNSSQNTPKVPKFRQRSGSTSSTSSSSSSDDEEEHFSEDPISGWPKLASLMSKTPDFAAFPRFRDLNVKSLLYYQVELTKLRKRLHRREYLDAKDKQYSQRADFLVGDKKSEQYKLIKKIRKLLKEYNEALLQYSAVSALPEPDAYNMRSLFNWLRRTKYGEFHIRGVGDDSWGDIYKKKDIEPLPKQFRRLLWTLIWPQSPPGDDLDLVVTRPQTKIDGFTQWLVWYLIPFYEAWRNRRKVNKPVEFAPVDIENDGKSASNRADQPESNGGLEIDPPEHWEEGVEKGETIESWSEKSLLRFTSGVSTVVACLLPVIAIILLSRLHKRRDLLLCLAGFSIIFAVGLIFLTRGMSTRVEIFTATSAFAAVMVVFISPSSSG